MQTTVQRYLLLFTGATLALIGLAYCVDPNILLSRYEINVVDVSEDNMYRGAYGGLFVTLGLAIGYGFFSKPLRRTATVIGLLFMAGFAVGRASSIISLGMPHEQIVGLFVFELVWAAAFGWLLVSEKGASLANGPQRAV